MASIKDVVAHIGFFIHRQMYFNRKFLVEGVGWKLECHEDTFPYEHRVVRAPYIKGGAGNL